jgi:hypothetical protein
MTCTDAQVVHQRVQRVVPKWPPAHNAGANSDGQEAYHEVLNGPEKDCVIGDLLDWLVERS